MSVLRLEIAAVAAETPTVRRIVLKSADGGTLPGFAAGAHVVLELPGIGVRKYSLVNAEPVAGVTAAPRHYMLGVRLDPDGGGGSRTMHALGIGDVLVATGPDNDFALRPGSTRVELVAGGIGVTPLVSMAAELRVGGRPFRLHYAVRTRAELAFSAELERLAGDGLVIHIDDEAGRVFDIDGLLAGLPADEPVYICGPKPMLKAAVAASRRLGWPKDRLKFELFYSVGGPAPIAAPSPPAAASVPPKPAAAPEPKPDGAFEVELKSSGKVFRVPPDKSILDVLIDAGVDPIHDCKKGECGVCQVGIVEGVPDHRDVILSDSERAAGKVMQICISRSKSPRLVLDL